MSGKTCSCGAEILLLPTFSGWGLSPPKMMPLDVEPHPHGNVVIEPAEGAIPPRARVLKKGQEQGLAPDRKRYMTHFATCPRAASYRR